MTGTEDISRDPVEELKRALQGSEARFRNLVTLSIDGIIIIDNQGVIRFANPAAADLFGRTAEDLLGEPFGFPIVSGETTELDILGRGRGIIAEVRVNKTWWDGAPVFLLTLRDITERKQAEEQIERLNAELASRAAELEDANRELEAFNYTVAHDLRKPLTVISSYCQAISTLCSNHLDENCRKYLQEIEDGTSRMHRLIEALISFSRMARIKPKREQVVLSALAQEVALELKLAEQGRRGRFHISEGLTTTGDPNLLRVVLANLLGNAWKFTAHRDEAVIEFGTCEIDGEHAWFVRDNGEGFAREDAIKLFLPFQRLPGAEDFQGFGIGLATVDRIIQRHGGRIWAEGEPGKGATFYFTLAVE